MTQPATGDPILARWRDRFVGVVPPTAFADQGYPKHLMLMFDALALDLGSSFHVGRLPPNVKADMAWLSQEGLLSTIGGITARPNSMRTPKIIDGGLLPRSAMRNVNFTARSAMLAAGGFGIRETASDLRSKYGIDAVAIPQDRPTDLDEPLTRDTVVRITLTHFPVPSEITPWEAIKDFRQDEEARTQWLMLKQWINELARSDKKPFEVADYIEFLAADYRESLRLARMQTQSGTLEVLLTTTAEVAESLVKVKWKDAVKAAFQVSRHKANLLASERGLPGRQVAYILKAKDKFGS